MKDKINKLNIELFTLSIAHGLNHIYKIFFTSILPLIVAQFNITYTEIGFLISMSYIAYGLVSFPAGILVDKLGRKNVMIFSILIPGIVCLIGGFAENYIFLLFSFVLLGISGGLYHPSSMAYITEISTLGFRGKAFGIQGIGGNIGMMLAPVITSFIASYLGWRGSFWLWSLPGIFMYFFMKNILPEDDVNNSVIKDKNNSLKFIKLNHVLALVIVVITGFLFEGVFVYLPVLLMENKEFTPLMSYFSKIVPIEFQGTSYGIYFGSQFVSGAFAPVLGGFITDKFSLLIFFLLLSFISLGGGIIIMFLNIKKNIKIERDII